jgi:hypothetical protein
MPPSNENIFIGYLIFVQFIGFYWAAGMTMIACC